MWQNPVPFQVRNTKVALNKLIPHPHPPSGGGGGSISDNTSYRKIPRSLQNALFHAWYGCLCAISEKDPTWHNSTYERTNLQTRVRDKLITPRVLFLYFPFFQPCQNTSKLLNITFMFDSFHHSWAAVTIVTDKCDSKYLKCTFAISNISVTDKLPKEALITPTPSQYH